MPAIISEGVVVTSYDEIDFFNIQDDIKINFTAKDSYSLSTKIMVSWLMISGRDKAFYERQVLIESARIADLIKGIDALLEFEKLPARLPVKEVSFTMVEGLRILAWTKNDGEAQFSLRVGSDERAAVEGIMTKETLKLVRAAIIKGQEKLK